MNQLKSYSKTETEKGDSEIYDEWLWTARNWGQQSLYPMYQKCSATKLSTTVP